MVEKEKHILTQVVKVKADERNTQNNIQMAFNFRGLGYSTMKVILT